MYAQLPADPSGKIKELFQLLPCRRLIRFISPGKMSENPFDFNPRSFHAFSDKGKAALIRTDSDTAHSRIHLDMYFHRAAAGNGRFSHFLQHILTEHGRADFLSCHFLIAVGKGIAQNQHRFAYAAAP